MVVENCEDIRLLREILIGEQPPVYHTAQIAKNQLGRLGAIFAELSARQLSSRRRLAGAPGG